MYEGEGKEIGYGWGKGRINVFRKHEEGGGPPRPGLNLF